MSCLINRSVFYTFWAKVLPNFEYTYTAIIDSNVVSNTLSLDSLKIPVVYFIWSKARIIPFFYIYSSPLLTWNSSVIITFKQADYLFNLSLSVRNCLFEQSNFHSLMLYNNFAIQHSPIWISSSQFLKLFQLLKLISFDILFLFKINSKITPLVIFKKTYLYL